MGCYINPTTSKESWLETFGRPISELGVIITELELPVCLVNNGSFSAAAVAFCQSEIDAFSNPRDARPRRWYMVTRGMLYQVSDLKSWESAEEVLKTKTDNL